LAVEWVKPTPFAPWTHNDSKTLLWLTPNELSIRSAGVVQVAVFAAVAGVVVARGVVLAVLAGVVVALAVLVVARVVLAAG